MTEFLVSGIVEYTSAMHIMEQRVHNVASAVEDELVWFLEHPSIYTAGVSAIDSDLIDPRFPVYKTSRGGKITYHGPGQRIIYAVLNLRDRGYISIIDYITDLANWIIDVLAAYGIFAFFDRDLLGIWVYEGSARKKIAALGVRIKKCISYHGVALNVRNDLSHYNGIVPCGIKEYGVASMKSMGQDIELSSIDIVLKDAFLKVFSDRGVVSC